MANITLLTGDAAAPQATSIEVSTSTGINLGTRAVDANGNIYVFVNFTGTVYSGVPVAITPGTWTAAAVGTSGAGPIGVAMGTMTSDQLGWVMVYGRTLLQIGGGGASISDAVPTTLRTSVAIKFTLPTSLSSPASLLTVTDVTDWEGYVVYGLYIAEDASTASPSAEVTSATSNMGSNVGVFLNFPYVVYVDLQPSS